MTMSSPSPCISSVNKPTGPYKFGEPDPLGWLQGEPSRNLLSPKMLLEGIWWTLTLWSHSRCIIIIFACCKGSQIHLYNTIRGQNYVGYQVLEVLHPRKPLKLGNAAKSTLSTFSSPLPLALPVSPTPFPFPPQSKKLHPASKNLLIGGRNMAKPHKSTFMLLRWRGGWEGCLLLTLFI